MKPNIFLIFLLIGGFLYAQEKERIQLEWSGPQSYVSEESSVELPHFKGVSYDVSQGFIPQVCGHVAVNSWMDVGVSLTQINVETLSSDEIRLIKKMSIKGEFQLEYNLTGKQKSPFLSYCIVPIRKKNGVYEKLISAELIWASKRAAKTSATTSFKTSSVLAIGNWYKVSVPNTGVYKLTPSYLSEIGMGSNIAIGQIRVYGNGEGQLPEANWIKRHDDLEEVAIKIVDQNGDGIFNGSDYALFFAKGAKQWEYLSGNYSHRNHLYDDKSYYFITLKDGGKRLSNAPPESGSVTHDLNTFDDCQFIEEDKVNIVGSGKRWFGDLFDFSLSYNYTFQVPDIDLSEPVKIYTVGAARSQISKTIMSVSHNGAFVSSFEFPTVSGSNSDRQFQVSMHRSSFSASSSNVALTVSYNNSVNPSAVAWLDYIEIVARRQLKFTSGVVFKDHQSAGAGNFARYNISSMSATGEVWEVTDQLNPKKVNLSLSGSQAQFIAAADSIRSFVMVDGSSFATPAKEGKVMNQNLHEMEKIDYVIVTHPDFLSEANRLADHHRNHSGLSVAVVLPSQVYNEFSSGAQDVTAIKDMMRMLYQKAASPEEMPKYLLLFGDASFDFKGRVTPNQNFVPIYQSSDSYSLYTSYSTDDYFGFLDETEGTKPTRDVLDLGIGRFPVTSVSQAKTVVDKTISYLTNDEAKASWRNNLLFVSDDVDESWETELTNINERLTKSLENRYPVYNYQKIYTDSYTQQSSSGSQRYPEARQELFRRVQSGNLITTYVGHGGEVGWASERILQLDDVNGWTNNIQMPLFVTITCEFSRLDDPLRVSAGEQLFQNPNGGACALFSTTRVVYVNPAEEVLVAIFDTILENKDGSYPTLGQVGQYAKNEVEQGERMRFSLLGDPAMKLTIPEKEVVTTLINGNPVGIGSDTLKALSKVRIEGEVRDEQGVLLSNYNGIVNPTIFDKKADKKTLMNDGVGYVINYKLFENLIYNGKVQATGGKFSYEFIVPLDISYSIGEGRISYYSTDKEEEARGIQSDVVVGGLNVNAPEDNLGPVVDLYLNDPSFVNGGMTSPNPILYANLSDSSGINTVGNGIGHDLIGILDDDMNNVLVLNEYFEAELNSYQTGRIQYPLYNLSPGKHQLLVRVWDVYNNPSEELIEFVVAESEGLIVDRVLNWPNPFTTYTEFQFEHNRASEPLDVQVQIFSVSGQLVKTINQNIQSSSNRVTSISWDGRDEYGDKIGKGVYVYKLKVRSNVDKSTAEKTEKLVILQ